MIRYGPIEYWPEMRDRITAIAARYAPRRRTILNQLEKTARERVLRPETTTKKWAEQVARYHAWQEATRNNPDAFMVFEKIGGSGGKYHYVLLRWSYL